MRESGPRGSTLPAYAALKAEGVESVQLDEPAFARELDAAVYLAAVHAEIDRVVRLQEELGLDVLVHGEPERNDMLQYFAEQLAGFASTEHDWEPRACA